MALRHHTTGNTRSWEHRPSDHVRNCAHRRYVDGPILPMEGDPPSLGIMGKVIVIVAVVGIVLAANAWFGVTA